MVPSAGLAISAILRNKMRSALTMLGIIIGVGAVVMMQSMRGGATAYVSELISGLGSNMPIAFPGTPRGFGQMTTGVPLFTLNDLGACRNPNPNENRTMNKTDNQLKQDIESELRWDPKVNSAQIGVSVDKGAVTLLGAVDTYAQKWAAEDATKRVFGVLTVAQDLTVKILADHKRSDSDVAGAVQSALKWDVFTPNSITAKVQNGAVTLEGQVRWNFERDAAERAVRYLTGVVSVHNSITLKPQTSTAQVKEKIESALQRQATTDSNSIHIDTSGGKVTLTGHASSWQSIDDARNAAWAAPGVNQVVDQLRIQSTY